MDPSRTYLFQTIYYAYIYVRTLYWTCVFLVFVWPLLYIYREIVILAAKWLKRSELHGLLDTDSHIFASDGYADNPTTCSMVCVLELRGKIRRDLLTKFVEENVVNAKLNSKSSSSSGELKYPQLKYFPYSFMGYWFWKSESNFKTETHIKTCPRKVFKSDSLLVSASEIHQFVLNTPFPKNQSPWDITLFRNSHNVTTFVAVRLHHSLGDGKSLLQLIVKHLGGKMQSTAKVANLINRPIVQTHWLWKLIRFPFILVENHLSLQYISKQSANHPWRVDKYESDSSQLLVKMSKPFYLREIKSASERHFGICTSAFFLAAITGASKRFLEMRDRHKDNRNFLWIPFAIEKPRHPATLKNHFSLRKIILPTSISSSVIRLQLCNERYLAARRDVSCVPCAERFVMQAVVCIPQSLRDKISLFGSYVTAFTNLAGEEEEFSVNGMQCLDLSFSAGQPRSSIGVQFLVLSYCGKLRFTVVSRESTITKEDCKILVSLLEDEMDLLTKKCFL